MRLPQVLFHFRFSTAEWKLVLEEREPQDGARYQACVKQSHLSPSKHTWPRSSCKPHSVTMASRLAQVAVGPRKSEPSIHLMKSIRS